MRLKFFLRAVTPNSVIPINYYYHFSSAIYLLLRFGSEEFAKFLHDIGFTVPGKKKNFKLFAFAVEFKRITINQNLINLVEPEVFLTISSPIIEPFVKNFIIGVFTKQNIFINFEDLSTKFNILQVEKLSEPIFKDEMIFNTLSPITLSKPIEKNDKPFPYYLRYDDPELSQFMKSNLLDKYKVVHNKQLEVDDFTFEFDKDEIERKKGKVSKLITIAERSLEETKIKAIKCDFKIKTHPELIKIGYECGFGAKNSMGFGLVKAAK